MKGKTWAIIYCSVNWIHVASKWTSSSNQIAVSLQECLTYRKTNIFHFQDVNKGFASIIVQNLSWLLGYNHNLHPLWLWIIYGSKGKHFQKIQRMQANICRGYYFKSVERDDRYLRLILFSWLTKLDRSHTLVIKVSTEQLWTKPHCRLSSSAHWGTITDLSPNLFLLKNKPQGRACVWKTSERKRHEKGIWPTPCKCRLQHNTTFMVKHRSPK
jgi:hypothetical protein